MLKNAIRAERLISLIAEVKSALNLENNYTTNFPDLQADDPVLDAREAQAALIQRLESAEAVLESLRICSGIYEEEVERLSLQLDECEENNY